MTNQPKLSEILGLKCKRPVINDQGMNNRIKDKAYCRGYEQCIKDINQLSPDVDELAKQIYLSEILCRTEEDWDYQGDIQKIYRIMANRIISSMHKWIKKGK